MSTTFPTAVDLFVNPATLKTDGEDLVRAAHVNDLQDSVVAIQDLLITPGVTFEWADALVPDDTNIVNAIKLVSAAADTNTTGLQDHIDYVLLIDPIQHHANVIEVTPGANLASDRLQTALEEHQVDIDNIMSGGLVEGATLDDRYVGKTGTHTMAGSLTIQNSITVEGSTTHGTAPSDSHTFNGTLIVADLSTFAGDANFDGDIQLALNKTIGSGLYNGMKISGADELSLLSGTDMIFQVDADDLIDGGPFAGTFRWKDGSTADIMTLTEAGLLTAADVIADTVTTGTLTMGTLSITDLLLKTNQATYHLDLDNDASGTGERFFVTKNNDSGASLASADLLLDLNASATLTTGIHKLKPGIEETGFFGLKEYSPDPGTIFYGSGVNFKTVMSNAPSSITLTPIASTNYQNLNVTFSNTYGFFFEFSSIIVGPTSVYGTYTTVGN